MSGFNSLVWVMRGSVLVLLFGGLLLLFHKLQLLRRGILLLRQTRQYMDEAARRRLLENRRNLLTLQQENSLLYRLEQELHYSGWKRKFPDLTAEKFLAGNIVMLSLIFLILSVFAGVIAAALGVIAAVLGETVALLLGKVRAMRSVNGNLMKFLDFLGNYSITSGELTAVFGQVARYVEEPLKSVLEECCFEAQTTGDTAMALLTMAEKIEHPRFKELVRNMEISIRYAADFSILVQNSRRTLREYLRAGAERKSLLREAVINMLLLVGLSYFIFLIVDGLIDGSIWRILFGTMPGRLALGVLAVIFGLFLRQIYRINR